MPPHTVEARGGGPSNLTVFLARGVVCCGRSFALLEAFKCAAEGCGGAVLPVAASGEGGDGSEDGVRGGRGEAFSRPLACMECGAPANAGGIQAVLDRCVAVEVAMLPPRPWLDLATCTAGPYCKPGVTPSGRKASFQRRWSSCARHTRCCCQCATRSTCTCTVSPRRCPRCVLCACGCGCVGARSRQHTVHVTRDTVCAM